MKLHAVEIEINTQCNLSCSYCPNSVASRPEQGDMSIQLFTKIMHELNSLDFKGRLSYHFYGEPLLNSNLTAYITKAYQLLTNRVRHVLFTNGTLLTKDKLDELIESGIHLFVITKHEQISHLPLDDFFSTLPEQTRQMIRYGTHQQLQKTNRGGLVSNISSSTEQVKNRPCLIPSHSIYITSQGKVLPCFEDYLQQHVMGSLQQESLSAIIKKDKYQSFIKNCKNGEREKNSICKHCISTQIYAI